MDRFIYKDPNRRESTKKRIGPNPIFNTIFAKILLLTVSFFLFYNIINSVNITIQKLDIHKRAQREVDELRLKNLELALLLENMGREEYLEIQARDRLNFSGEKEYLFVVPVNLLEETKLKVQNILSEEDCPYEGPPFEVWADFLVNGI
jgi:cell division protein FtsB